MMGVKTRNPKTRQLITETGDVQGKIDGRPFSKLDV
jgi:hypothetical protein